MDERGGPGGGLRIVIVNYRCAALTLDCLASLAPQVAGRPGWRVVVTDNASGDGSAERLAAAVAGRGWSSWAEVLPLPTNGGFAAGNNAALRPALAEPDPPRHLLLLNPDTIVRPGALDALVGFLDAHPEVGIAGSRLEDPDGTPQVSAFRFFSVLGELEAGLRLGLATRLLSRWVVWRPPADAPHPADWVSGACLLVRREVFEAVGLLDEGYFMYYEETDFCRRARDAGWPCWYVPAARVVHLVGRSTSDGAADGPRRLPPWWYRSRRRYLRAHLGPLRSRLADLAWLGGYVLFRARAALQRKPVHDPPRLLGDFVRSLIRDAGAGRPAPSPPNPR